MTRALVITLLLTVVTPCSTAPGQALADLWDGQAKWDLAAEKVGGDFTFHCLSILPQDGKLLGYYIANYTAPDGKHRMGIGRARSDDGISWTDEGRLLNVGEAGAWDDRAASFPGIWKDGETWYLVYEGAADDIGFSPGDIGLATSSDGKNFTKHPDNPILRHEKTGWERVNIGTPSLYKENGTWYLFYHGFDGTLCHIGVASGTSLTDLEKSPANPIIPAGERGAWDEGATGKRSAIVKEGEFYYLAFEGRTPLPDSTARWSSGLARSRALTSGWSKCPRNPLIPTTPGYFGYDAPELLHHRDAWLLYVRSPGANATHVFKLASDLAPPPPAPRAQPRNARLADLPANQWVQIHQQRPDDMVRFKRQEHGGSCFDSKRCRIVLFGSNTHGQDWTNSPLIFDVVAGEWSRLYPDDDESTYRAAGDDGIAVAGEAGDHPWAMHTFGAVQYDPQRDEMVVASWPEHLKPGRFTDALKDVWPTVKKHPTWTFSFATNKWTPLAGKPQHFFPYACAYDSDRKVIIGYGGNGIWELVTSAEGERTWTRIDPKTLCGYHNNAAYDSANKALLVYGSHEKSDDMIVYRPATKEHRKMPTPGVRPPKDQHTPMCFDPRAQRTVVVVDRGGSTNNPQKGNAETWLYDLSADAWTQVASATLPFGCGMNYNMHYDDRHNVCLLVTQDFSKPGRLVTVYALRVDLATLKPAPAPATAPAAAPAAE